MERYPKTLWKFLENQDLGLLERLKIAINLVKEVKTAHNGYLVHRDLKPTKVMLDANKELTLVDFGIGSDWKTLAGSCGTPGFNAPEQFLDYKQERPVDIFSLGKNLILIFFKWKIGWTLLCSSKDWISSQKNAENKLATFSDYFNVIQQMLQVNFFHNFATIFNIFLQMDPSERPALFESDAILKVLESLARKIRNDPKIEADWLSFHSLIKVPAEFNVDERTLSSRDLFKEISQMNLNVKSGEIVTGGTRSHDQKDTNFCAYFATMSALRRQLRKTVGSEISGKDTSKIDPKETEEYFQKVQEKEAKKYAGFEIKEYLKRRDEDEKGFERDLSVMIGCVNPRSLSARFKITLKSSTFKNRNKNC